jgi:APA family basic amino acid/polyamine antiporter
MALGRASLDPGTRFVVRLWVTFASGYQAVYQAMVLVLIGIPLYAFLKACREPNGQVPELVELTELEAEAEFMELHA